MFSKFSLSLTIEDLVYCVHGRRYVYMCAHVPEGQEGAADPLHYTKGGAKPSDVDAGN